MIVMMVSICSSRLTTGLDSPPPVRATAPDSLLSAKAWNAITVTMPVVVTATFAALRSERRGRRATSRSPNSAGIGSLLEMRTRAPRRFGGRPTSLSAATVLPRDARMAGTSVAASDTTIASPMTCTTVPSESGGAPAVPMRAAPGLVISGAASQPTARPTTAANSASTRFSARKVAATTLGVPPTAFSSPTRRAYSDSRRPTSTATLAIASSARRNAPGWSTPCPSWISFPSSDASPCQVENSGAVALSVRAKRS